MELRKLERKDAPLMLEWMHDEDVVRNMNRNFAEMTLQDCIHFIEMSWNPKKAIHLAVVDEQDCYMGTVSLKNLGVPPHCAEFAITMRKCAMGKGYAQFGMKEIMKRAFSDFGMEKVYWYVSKENVRAVRFYEKMGYPRMGKGIIREIMALRNKENHIEDYIWYESTHISC